MTRIVPDSTKLPSYNYAAHVLTEIIQERLTGSLKPVPIRALESIDDLFLRGSFAPSQLHGTSQDLAKYRLLTDALRKLYEKEFDLKEAEEKLIYFKELTSQLKNPAPILEKDRSSYQELKNFFQTLRETQNNNSYLG